jgi:lipopolysaccharide transport system permease protein
VTASEQVYVARRRRSYRDAFSELVTFREVTWAFAVRTVRLKYKQAVLGVAWAVVQPLATLGIFVLVFTRIGNIRPTGGASYAATTLAAVIAWQFVATAISLGSSTLVAEGGVLRKVYFPRDAPVLAAVGAAFVDLCIGMALAMILVPLLGGSIGVSLVALPVVVAVLALPVIAVALALAALYVHYRDLRFVVPLFVQLAMLASPVAYPLNEVPQDWRGLYELLNPLVGPLEGIRRVVAEARFPDWGLLAQSAAVSGVLVLLGYALFLRLEADFADVV